MFAVASGAIGGVPNPGFDGPAVHTLEKRFCDFLVAGTASRRDIPVAYAGTSVTGRKNFMAAMAVRAGGRILACEHGASMNALQVLLDRIQSGNFVPRQESRIGVAGGTSCREVLFRNLGDGFAGHLTLVHRPVAGSTSGSVRVAGLRGEAVNALREGFALIRVT